LKIKVLTFGIFTDIFSASSVELTVPLPISVKEFKDFIKNKFTETKELKFTIAVNESYANDDEIIEEGNIIALIPPVSGG